ncbi:MAG TPA: hypothetical protein VHE80_00230 [Acidimicrobiales bacterium]|nr:hypothetical protein [Acidimicrobiales bacterium]
MRPGVRWLAVAAVALAVPACGDDGEDLSPLAATTLQGQVGEVRAAVVAEEPDDARLELAELRATVGRLRGGGEVSDQRADAILAAAALVESHLGLLVRPPEPPRQEVRPPAADDLEEEIDEAVRQRVEEARKRAQEQIKEAEKKAEDARKKAGRGGGEGED